MKTKNSLNHSTNLVRQIIYFVRRNYRVVENSYTFPSFTLSQVSVIKRKYYIVMARRKIILIIQIDYYTSRRKNGILIRPNILKNTAHRSLQ